MVRNFIVSILGSFIFEMYISEIFKAEILIYKFSYGIKAYLYFFADIMKIVLVIHFDHWMLALQYY